MRSQVVQSWFRRTVSGSTWALGAVLLVLGAGCPGGVVPPPDNGNDNGNQNGNENSNDNQADGEIISPSTNFGISALDPPVSVLYSVVTTAANVRGYYVPVADAGTDSPETGARTVTATNLPTGERKAFSFDPQEAGVGYFRVGILFAAGAVDNLFAESRAVIQVQGPPDPTFILPQGESIEVTQGAAVQVTFDVRDPEGVTQWRLFYFPPLDALDGPPDEFGTELTVGSGNVGTFAFATEELSAGEYQLGLSATDSGRSISATVDSGDLDRIVTIPSDSTPTPLIRVVAAP